MDESAAEGDAGGVPAPVLGALEEDVDEAVEREADRVQALSSSRTPPSADIPLPPPALPTPTRKPASVGLGRAGQGRGRGGVRGAELADEGEFAELPHHLLRLHLLSHPVLVPKAVRL